MSEKSALRRAVEDITGGTMGGIALTIAGHPLDTLKVRLQTQPTINPLYTGMLDCATKTVKAEGFGGLYRGVTSPLVGQAFFNAVQFMAYGQVQKWILGREVRQGERLTIPQYFAAGAGVGAFVAFVESPMDLFKSKLQVQVFREKPLYNTVSGAVGHIWKQAGLRGIYQGVIPTLVRDIPSVSLYFGAYELVREGLTKPGESVNNLAPSKLLLAGGVGGIMYWGLNYPFDVIKSAMQADATLPYERKYQSMSDCARQLYAEGGMKRFYRGYTPCMLRSVPANAVCFFAYEKTKEFFNRV